MEITIKNAKAKNLKVSVCGESAAVYQCARLYMEMGVDILSMSTGAVIPIKKEILRNE